MHIKLCEKLFSNGGIRQTVSLGGKDSSGQKAYKESDRLSIGVVCPRFTGIPEVYLKITKDSEDTVIRQLECHDSGVFSLEMSFSEGLYFYSFIFKIGGETFYSVTENETDIKLSRTEGREYRLLVTSDSCTTPDWFKGGTMYHVFVDRFNKSGKSSMRADAVNEENWYAPVSQFGEKPGDFVKNNLFYGGDLYGVADKLDYLSSLGVSVIYLSPVFRAYSNHKYDTADYMQTDAQFGGDAALRDLIKKAENYGIKIILDGVFNHTGDNSVYFDRYGEYGGGAYKNPSSKYRSWYLFGENDDTYDSWWGIKILPKLNHKDENCRKFFTGEGGVLSSYVNKGIGGWRLDVADELSDDFLDETREAVKSADPDAIIIGEVWENAADKIAYGNRRRYLRGKQLDSVMNYPFRTALLKFMETGDGKILADELSEIYALYPKCVSDCLMNLVGTHDTERILTVLSDKNYKELSNRELSVHKMSENEKKEGIKLLKIASAIQYTVYGIPSLFYGDEAGVEGGRDPFCRAPFPWGREDTELLSHYKKLGEIRKNPVFREGSFKVTSFGTGYITFVRSDGDTEIITGVNLTDAPITSDIFGKDLLSGESIDGIIPPVSAIIVESRNI